MIFYLILTCYYLIYFLVHTWHNRVRTCRVISTQDWTLAYMTLCTNPQIAFSRAHLPVLPPPRFSLSRARALAVVPPILSRSRPPTPFLLLVFHISLLPRIRVRVRFFGQPTMARIAGGVNGRSRWVVLFHPHALLCIASNSFLDAFSHE